MTTLREAAEAVMEQLKHGWVEERDPVAQDLKAALAEPVQEPEQFDHGIGDDRFKVVRGAYWWHVLIGDGTKKYGKFHTQAGAEEMANLLLREFKNGAFVQHRERCREGPTAALMADLRAALAEPVQEPEPGEYHGWVLREVLFDNGEPVGHREPVQEPVAWIESPHGAIRSNPTYKFKFPSQLLHWQIPLYTVPPQRKPLTEEEIKECERQALVNGALPFEQRMFFARAIERAHGIGGEHD